MPLRHVLALQMTTLLAWSPVPARPSALGIVVEAERAHVNTTAVTAGTTIYNGDRYSTETRGALLLRAGTTMLELAEASAISLRNLANGAQSIGVELDQGTLLFGAARSADLEIVAREARVRPSAEGRTVAQISLMGPKELGIYAQRGGLLFSYRGETETIAQGESYRVILDPAEGDAKKGTIKAARERKTFLLVAIVGGSVGAAVGIYENRGHRHKESPDRP